MEEALIKITGQVQGVFYRANAHEKATELGLCGYCKNLPDGSVEALVQGDHHKIETFITWCKEGPPSAQVEKVTVTWQTLSDPNSDFKTL